MPPLLTLLHISDLHFDDRLTNFGRKLWKPFAVKTHSFEKADALSAKLRHMKLCGVVPDVLLVTGDATTDGAEGSFLNVRDFIEKNEIRSGTPPRLQTLGLGFDRTRRVMVPGNHDRYDASKFWPRQTQNPLFDRMFTNGRGYPYSLACKSAADDVCIVFFVFDSTATQLDAEEESFWNLTARGRLTNAECGWLEREIERIRNGGKVDDISGSSQLPVDLKTAIKIAVLHHHPLKPVDSSPGPISASLELTKMANSNRFVRACSDAQIDLVLFGHEHYFYRSRVLKSNSPGKTHATHFVCCASSTEYSTQRNGFLYIELYPESCVLNPFGWDGSGFVAEEPISLEFVVDLKAAQS